jgi:ABC-type multidrug transport system ATPase subunit
LLKLLTGEEFATTGIVLLGGKNITGRSRAWMRRNVGYVPQSPTFPSRRTLAQMLLPNGVDPKGEAYVGELCSALGLTRVVKRLGGLHSTLETLKVSGGEAQRLAIGRALAARPRLLLLDEVESNLDTASVVSVLKTIRQQARVQHPPTTVIRVTHRSACLDGETKVTMKEGLVVSYQAAEFGRTPGGEAPMGGVRHVVQTSGRVDGGAGSVGRSLTPTPPPPRRPTAP